MTMKAKSNSSKWIDADIILHPSIVDPTDEFECLEDSCRIRQRSQLEQIDPKILSKENYSLEKSSEDDHK